MKLEVLDNPTPIENTISEEKIRVQLELLAHNESFRSSKRSVAFLRYVVEETLRGTEQIKERTIGVEVFGRSASYEPNLDHIVRTAASEVRKRLAIYYGEEVHRGELHISITPGSYVPHFALPSAEPTIGETTPSGLQIEPPETPSQSTSRGRFWRRRLFLAAASAVFVLLAGWLAFWIRSSTEISFWQPVLSTHEPVLLAIGDVPHGPPTAQAQPGESTSTPVIAQPTAQGTVPFADAVTMARLYSTLTPHGKRIVIRPGSSVSFSDLREGPVVLIGAFNNPWSLRLLDKLRFSLALDDAHQLIYIRDAKNPGSRTWSWGTHQPVGNIGAAGMPALHDYALISRIRSPQTGHFLVVVGGLFVYGTQAAGEFLADPEALKALGKIASLDSNKSLQIVLETTVTDATPGPPRIVAVSEE